MFKIAVLVSGGGTNLQAIIDAVDKGEVDNVCISCVITGNPGAFALQRAVKHGIKTFVVSSSDSGKESFEEKLAKILIDENVQLIVLAGFMLILSDSFIQRFENMIINVHPSLIPSFCGRGYYGLKVHEEALKKGVKVTGATVHFVTAVPDGGPIILQKPVCVSDEDTPLTLQKKVMEQAEWKILPEAISLISKKQIEITDGIVRRIMR